eukprot:s1552_g3.t1
MPQDENLAATLLPAEKFTIGVCDTARQASDDGPYREHRDPSIWHHVSLGRQFISGGLSRSAVGGQGQGQPEGLQRTKSKHRARHQEAGAAQERKCDGLAPNGPPDACVGGKRPRTKGTHGRQFPSAPACANRCIVSQCLDQKGDGIASAQESTGSRDVLRDMGDVTHNLVELRLLRALMPVYKQELQKSGWPIGGELTKRHFHKNTGTSPATAEAADGYASGYPLPKRDGAATDARRSWQGNAPKDCHVILSSKAVAKELSSVSHGHGHGHGHKTAAHKAATSPGVDGEESDESDGGNRSAAWVLEA